jgi:DNA-binding MarR family transcriptional regulator
MSRAKPLATAGETPGDPGFEVANRLFFRLYQCSNLMHKNGTKYMAEFGSTTQQWAVLGALARPRVKTHGMSVKDLIEFLLLSRQNLTAVLDRLEARGWVERAKDPEDGRSRLIRLTAKGETIWAQMLNSIRSFYGDALEGFSLEDQILLYRLLDRMKDKLSAV